jgi:hypothetical protein
MSITELLVAFGLLTFVLVFNLQLSFFNEDSFNKAKVKADLLENVVETLNALDDEARENFDTLNYPLAKIKSLDPLIKEVEINNPLISFKRKYFNEERKREQNSCALNFVKDWKSPQVIAMASLSGSSTATAIKISGEFAYIAANSPKAIDPDLYIFDISDPSQPLLVTTLNTGPGLNDLELSWPYLYLANTSINSQLQVVDVNNAESPILKGSYKLPGEYKDEGFIGNTLAIYGNTLAIGTKKSDNNELHFYNIENPENIIYKSSFEINTLVNSILLRDKKAYVATALSEELKILDISNIEQPGYLSGYNGPSSLVSAKSLYYLDELYLGRTSGLEELTILSTASSTPRVISTSTLKTTIERIFAREGFLFLATSSLVEQFQIWKRSLDVLEKISSLTLSGRALDMDCVDETFFVVTNSSPTLYVIN